MNIDKFKKQVADASECEEVDELCFKWLAHMSSDFGRDGEIAKELLNIVKKLTVN